MNRELYRYNFAATAPMRDVEESLFLAVLATECLHGRSLVRLILLSRQRQALLRGAPKRESRLWLLTGKFRNVSATMRGPRPGFDAPFPE